MSNSNPPQRFSGGKTLEESGKRNELQFIEVSASADQKILWLSSNESHTRVCEVKFLFVIPSFFLFLSVIMKFCTNSLE